MDVNYADDKVLLKKTRNQNSLRNVCFIYLQFESGQTDQ